MSLVTPTTMCADYCTCNDDYEDALEYGFDVVSSVEQRPLFGPSESVIENLPKKLESGKALCICAATLPNCQRWAVNLLCGGEHSSDIAFHFNPRLLQHCIVRNCRVKGQWGNEEVLMLGKLDMKKNERFLLRIFTTDNQFFVSYNDKHVCSFRFRVQPSAISHVELAGKLEIVDISVENFDNYPLNGDGVCTVEEAERPLRSEGRKMETPLRVILPEGLQEDWQLEVYGTPKILPQSFFLELKKDIYMWPPSTIALNILANFGNNMLVRNAFIDNKWGNEERVGGFKFLPSQPFSLWIRRNSRKYCIWVNEKLQTEFTFRCDPDSVGAVFIQGDVDVRGVFVNKDPDKYMIPIMVSSKNIS